MNDSEVIQRFRGLYSGSLTQKRRDAGDVNSQVPWQEVSWLGKFVSKCPMDLWVYQELLYETRPDVLLETGTSGAGSAFFFASIFDLIGNGHVVTVDVDVYPHLRREHPRITYLVGDCVGDEIIGIMGEHARGKSTMVSLDSTHTYEHVKKEVAAYSQLVTQGQYLVVEDVGVYDTSSAEQPPHFTPAILADLTGFDSVWGTRAVAEFCREHPEFVQDTSRERHLMTSNVWLKRT
jgi:cephalosporin hydroxylase